MRKFGFFAFFCGLCGAAWAAASIRASSVPLSGGTTVSAPKVTVSTISTTPDSDNAKPTSNPTNVDINTSRIAFTSPLAKTNRYYVPTSGSGGTTSPTNTSNTEQEIAALQQQIDELVRKQTQLQDNLPTTVQTAIKNSDLTKNDSFNDAISELQESVVSDSAIDSKINEKLVDKGIVDTGGNLQVATKDEIQPIPLSQKLESTLAVKFAKKSDYTPSKIATNIANDTAAVTTLSNRIGTDESTVKNIIKSDLQKRGIVDNNNQLQVATKDELPVIDTETVSAALQNTPAFDNLVTQNLTNRGIYDANNQLQLVKKSEITPDFLATKLDSKYAKTGDIATLSNRLSIIQDGDENTSGSIANKLKTAGFARTSDITAESLSQKLDNIYVRPSAITPTALSNKLANVFVTPTELSNKNFATKSELPTVDETTVTAALRNSNILDSTIIKNLKNKNLLTDNEELNVATKSNLNDLSNRISGTINTLATKNEVSALDNRFAKATDVTPEKIAAAIADNATAKETLSGQIGPNTDQVNSIVTNKLKSTGILSNDNNETLQVATKDEINTTNAAISSVQSDITNLQRRADTIANNQLTRSDVENAIKSVDLTTQNDTLKTKLAAMDAIDAKVITTDNADNVLKDKYASKMLEESVAKLNADENTPGSIANKLQVATADLVKTSDITTENLSKKLDSKYASKTLESTVANLNGDIANENSLLYKIKNNSEIRTALKGDTGAAYIPNLDDDGNLSWRDEKGATITSLGTKNIRGQQGASGADGATFIPTLAADGTLSWTKGSANSELPTARNIKGADGATFIPAFDSATGKISWSRGTSGQTPDAIKIAKTDSELDTLVAGKISADTTISGLKTTVQKLDGADTVEGSVAYKLKNSGFAKTSDIFDTDNKLIASKLPSGVITDSNIDTKLSAKKIVTDDNLGTKLGTLKVITDDNIDSKLPTTVLRTGALTGYAKTSDIFDTDNKLIAAKLPSGVITSNNFDDVITAKKIITDNNIGSKLPSDILRTGALTDYAKTSDIFDTDNKLIAAKLPSGVITDSNLDDVISAKKIITDNNLTAKKLTDTLGNTYLTDSDLTASKLSGKLTGLYASADSVSASNLATKLNGTFAAKSTVDTLSTTINNLDGDISNQNSLLYKIKNNSEIRTALKGDPGTSVTIPDVTSALKSDQNFLDSVKGRDGTSYTLKGSVQSYANLPTTGNIKGDGWYVKSNGLLYVYSCDSDNTNCAYPAENDGLPFKGDDGATFVPNLASDGTLSWTKGSANAELPTSRNIKGADGATFVPSLASDGTLSWTKGSANAELPTSRNIKGADGATFVPNLASDGTLSWTKGSANAELPTSQNIKGQKGDDGATFVPAFNSETGKITWSRGTSGQTPSDMKIAKTDSELDTLVANKISADTTLARKTDIFNDGTTTLKTGLLPSDLVTSDTLTTRLGGYATTSTVSDLTTRTASLESNALTADNLSTKLSAENSAVKQALSSAGFAQTGDITATLNNTLNGTGEGSFASRLSSAGVITTGNIANNLPSTVVRSDNLPSNIITTGNLDNTTIKNALTGAGFAQSSEITSMRDTLLNGDENTTGSIAKKLKDANVVTSTNGKIAASALPDTVVTTSNITTDNNIKTALSDAGFAKTSDINSQVNNQALTMSDLGNILSQGILMVKSDGTLGLDPTKTSSGVGTKLSRVGNISNMTASTSIATSVAAATSAAVAVDSINDATKCNSTDYMYWDTRNTKCLKCPADEPNITKFIGGSARCQCADPMTEFSVAGGVCNKVSESQARCNQTENMYWNTYNSKCLQCPEESYYKGTDCLCQKDNMMLNTFGNKCMDCPPESEYNPETRLCTCKNGNSINHELWMTDPAQACAR